MLVYLMDAVQMLKERRSIRKYKDEVVSPELMEEIVDTALYAPSWANFQIVRYNLITNKEMIEKIAELGVNGFLYNRSTLIHARNLAVLSYVQGKSGKLDLSKSEYATSKSQTWEMFDAGIACQTFCLAAHERGVGTCIFGVFDDAKIAQMIDLPEGETVAALVVYGYPDEEAKEPSRKALSEVLRVIA